MNEMTKNHCTLILLTLSKHDASLNKVFIDLRKPVVYFCNNKCCFSRNKMRKLCLTESASKTKMLYIAPKNATPRSTHLIYYKQCVRCRLLVSIFKDQNLFLTCYIMLVCTQNKTILNQKCEWLCTMYYNFFIKCEEQSSSRTTTEKCNADVSNFFTSVSMYDFIILLKMLIKEATYSFLKIPPYALFQ